MTNEELTRKAIDFLPRSYAPYSGFHVAAALLTKDGKVYLGCNIENSSLGATNCAERTAFFKAVSEGNREFEAIAIIGYLEGKEPESYAFPCGICRQVMAEFCEPRFKIIVAKSASDYKVYSLDELLPESFGAENMI